jgi:hypothetical protein
VFNTLFLSNMYRFKVILAFVIVDYGGLSISTAKEHPRPEMMSPVDRVTMVSCKCSMHVSSLLCTVNKLFAFFHLALVVVCRFRPLGGAPIRKLRRRSIVRPLVSV